MTLPQFIGIIAATILLLIYNWLDYAPYFALFVIMLLVFQFVYIANIENKKRVYNSFKVELEKNINNIEWIQNKKNEIKEHISLNVGSSKINRLKLEKLESVVLLKSTNNIDNKNSNEEVDKLNEKINELNEKNSNKTEEISRLNSRINELEKNNIDYDPQEIKKLQDTIEGINKELEDKVLVKPIEIQNLKQNEVAKILDLMCKIGLFKSSETDVMRAIEKCCNCTLTNFSTRIKNHKDRTSMEVQSETIYKLIEHFEINYGIKIKR